MITVVCPNCQDTLNVPEQYAGQRGTCKKCNGPLTVPALNSPAPAAGGLDLPMDLTSALDASLNRERPRPVVAPNTLGDKLGPLLKPLGIVVGIAAVVAIVLGGIAYMPKLGPASVPSPESVTGSFLQALKTGDMQQCQPYMTEKAWQSIGAMPTGAMPPMEGYTVGAATTTGETSQVTVQVTQMGMTVPQDVLLRKENGPWRVYGIRMTPMPGMTMTIDFENPEAIMEEMKKMMQGMPPEMMQGMEEAMRQQMAQ